MISSSAAGDNAVSVLVTGDSNTVTIERAGARLSLEQRHKMHAEWTQEDVARHSELDLLLTEHRAIDLVGREVELSQLCRWLGSEQSISFWCACGRGGAGKTRIGIELCERAEASGWDAGFVRDNELRRFHSSQSFADWRWLNPTLMVVDYAGASLEILREWLDELAGLVPKPDRPPLRLLLLEREADSESGWWHRLTSDSGLSTRGPARLVASAEPLRLQPIKNPSDKRAMLQQVIDHATARLGKPALALPPPGSDTEFDRWLGGDGPDMEPLYLAMAGIVAVREGLTRVRSLDRGALAKLVAANEARRLERLARSWGFENDASPVLHLAACVTLQGGCDRADMAGLLQEERRALNYASALTDEALAERLCDALGTGGSGRADSIRPDLIGGAFVLEEVQRHASPERGAAMIERAWRRDSDTTIATLIRIAQDFAGFRSDHCSVRWLAHLVEGIDSPEQLIEIANMLPQQTLALLEFGEEVQRRVVALARELDLEEHKNATLLATALIQYSRLLDELGRREEALKASAESVELLERMVDASADARHYLATALTGHANVLGRVGRRDEALKAASRALEIVRELAASQPEVFKSDLAVALNNYAIQLRDLGQRKEAAKVMEEALAVRRDLAEQCPEDFRPSLAGSLSNYAIMLGDLGQTKKAVSFDREAVEILRDLAALRPDAFRLDFAMALNNYSNRLSGVGLHREALDAARESVEMLRPLAALRPDAFLPELALVLSNYSGELSELGFREDALAAVEESVSHYDALSATHPEAFLPSLALALSVLADRLEENGREDESLAADEKAIDTLADMFAAQPLAFAANMATYCRDYEARCERHGRAVNRDLLGPIEMIFATLGPPDDEEK
jgi:tetratricopeptide (TPR) repeat protein